MDEWRCPDLPGHGPDPQLDCTPVATAQFIEARRKDSNILLGYSMGARAALLHALRDPEKWDALILISVNPGIACPASRIERKKNDDLLAEEIEQSGVSAFLDFWQNTPMIRSQKAIDPNWATKMQADRLRHIAIGLANSLRQFGQGNFPNLWPRLSQLKMPVLLMTGSSDKKYSAIAAQIIEQTRSPEVFEHFLIDGCGHMPHLESPVACAAKIDDFLRRRLNG